MDKGTQIRTIALLITYVNMVLANYGLQPIPVLDDEMIAIGLAGVATAYGWFYNNYITWRGRRQKEELEKAGLVGKNKKGE